MLKIFLVGLGGFVGSGFRFILSTFVYRLLGTDFPYGTFIVNVLGSFVIGFFMGLVEVGVVVSPNWRLFIAVGLLGGFTTFSTFSYETVELLKEGLIFLAIVNVFVTVVSCIGMTWVGGVLARLLTK